MGGQAVSGGHWDYLSHRIQEALEQVAADEFVKRRWPKVGTLLNELAPILAQIEHDMDWDICSDSSIPDDAKWEAERIGQILEAAMIAAPDEWFPRGKWATIQAVQGRIAQWKEGE